MEEVDNIDNIENKLNHDYVNDTNSNSENDYEVLMSPLLSNKLSIIDNKFEELNNKISNILEYIKLNNSFLLENKLLLSKTTNENTALKDHNSRIHNIIFKIYNEFKKDTCNIKEINSLLESILTYKMTVDEEQIHITGLKNPEFNNLRKYD